MRFPKCEGERQRERINKCSNDSSKKNHFYALRYKGEQQTSLDMVIGMWKVFSINLYVLLDPGATLHFFTPLISKKFDILPNISNEPFMVSTPVGESVVAKRVYINFPIMFTNRVTYVKLVEFDMINFDVILGMDWLNACFSSIDCRTRVVKFNFPNKPVLEWKGVKSIPRGSIISYLKACRMTSKGILYRIVRVQDLDSKIHPIEFVPIVRKF